MNVQTALTVEVRRQDLIDAIINSPSSCPISRAIMRGGASEVWVGRRTVRWTVPGKVIKFKDGSVDRLSSHSYIGPLPDEIIKWQKRLTYEDRFQIPLPKEFTLVGVEDDVREDAA